jgi:hypothetical protein
VTLTLLPTPETQRPRIAPHEAMTAAAARRAQNGAKATQQPRDERGRFVAAPRKSGDELRREMQAVIGCDEAWRYIEHPADSISAAPPAPDSCRCAQDEEPQSYMWLPVVTCVAAVLVMVAIVVWRIL